MLRGLIKAFIRQFNIGISSHQLAWQTFHGLSNYHAQNIEEKVTSELTVWINKLLEKNNIKTRFIEETKPNEGGRWNSKKNRYSIIPTGRDIFISFETMNGKAAMISIQAKRLEYDSSVYKFSTRDEEQAKKMLLHSNTIEKILESFDITLATHVLYSCIEKDDEDYKHAITSYCSTSVQANKEIKVMGEDMDSHFIPKLYATSNPLLNEFGHVGSNDYLENLFEYLSKNKMVKKHDKVVKGLDKDRLKMVLFELEVMRKKDMINDYVWFHLENK